MNKKDTLYLKYLEPGTPQFNYMFSHFDRKDIFKKIDTVNTSEVTHLDIHCYEIELRFMQFKTFYQKLKTRYEDTEIKKIILHIDIIQAGKILNKKLYEEYGFNSYTRIIKENNNFLKTATDSVSHKNDSHILYPYEWISSPFKNVPYNEEEKSIDVSELAFERKVKETFNVKDRECIFVGWPSLFDTGVEYYEYIIDLEEEKSYLRYIGVGDKIIWTTPTDYLNIVFNHSYHEQGWGDRYIVHSPNLKVQYDAEKPNEIMDFSKFKIIPFMKINDKTEIRFNNNNIKNTWIKKLFTLKHKLSVNFSHGNPYVAHFEKNISANNLIKQVDENFFKYNSFNEITNKTSSEIVNFLYHLFTPTNYHNSIYFNAFNRLKIFNNDANFFLKLLQFSKIPSTKRFKKIDIDHMIFIDCIFSNPDDNRTIEEFINDVNTFLGDGETVEISLTEFLQDILKIQISFLNTDHDDDFIDLNILSKSYFLTYEV